MQVFHQIVVLGLSFHAAFMEQRRRHQHSASCREASSMEAMMHMIEEGNHTAACRFSMKVWAPMVHITPTW